MSKLIEWIKLFFIGKFDCWEYHNPNIPGEYCKKLCKDCKRLQTYYGKQGL